LQHIKVALMLLEFNFVLDTKWKFHYAYSTFK